MARERMVTRTVTLTEVEAICLDVVTVETTVNHYKLGGFFSDTEQALKTLKKLHETDTFKVVAVREMIEQEVLYGMSEQDFIKLAKVLPPRAKTEEQE